MRIIDTCLRVLCFGYVRGVGRKFHTSQRVCVVMVAKSHFRRLSGVMENSNVSLTHSIGVEELSRIRTTVEYRRLGELHPIPQIGHRHEGLVCVVGCIQ